MTRSKRRKLPIDKSGQSDGHLDNVDADGAPNIDPNLNVMENLGQEEESGADPQASQNSDVFPLLFQGTDSDFVRYIRLWS
jgi:hypothetical protein